MTEWTYKWVRVRTVDNTPDVANVEKHTAQGWEPVGAGDWPEGVDPTMGVSQFPVTDFVLYRCDQTVVDQRKADRLKEDQRLADPQTHADIANANIAKFKQELKVETGRPDAGDNWGPIENGSFNSRPKVV